MANTIQKPLPEDADAITGESGEHLEYLSDEEARKIFDEAARYYLGISGDEFLRRWDAGEWQNDPDHAPVMQVVSALSLVR